MLGIGCVCQSPFELDFSITLFYLDPGSMYTGVDA